MRTTKEQLRNLWMLSDRMRANCSGTASFSVASPSPVRLKACPVGNAASKRIGGVVRFATHQ